MTEMPMDVLNHRLGLLRDSGALIGDNTAFAVDIDEELQEKFFFIPQVEIDAVEIVDLQNHEDDPTLQAGSGPETVRANRSDNPDWLYHTAVHALAMYRHLIHVQTQEAEREKLAKRPAPGLYKMGRIIVGVTPDQRVMVQRSGTADFADRTEMYDNDTLTGSDGRAWPLKPLGHDFGLLP